jgi:Protein of unknown function (DUF3047)
MTPSLRELLLVFAMSLLVMPLAAGDAHAPPGASSSPAATADAGPILLWNETFRGPLQWKDPQDHGSLMRDRVYAVLLDGGNAFLHARHDATAKGAPPAIHFGKELGVPLSKVRLLRWRWRARVQPLVREDPWEDMAASIYVVTRVPSLLRKGRGFKFGWLAKAGPSQTYQRGLLQVAVRNDPPGLQWRTEEVDVCALYRRTFGACEDAQIVYIGVLTDADGLKSIAEGDYADFEIIGAP